MLDVWTHDHDGPKDLVRNTPIHEIGHHFGLSDAAMHRLEDED